jgi:beta-phosphoglucomutase-like phosphatase (HAD superfamily)
MHLVMFDIDGTLVDSAGFDTELYVEAVRSVLDVSIHSDWNAYEHVSDSGILRQVLRDTRLDGDPKELAARVQQRFVALVSDYLRRAQGAVREIAGAGDSSSDCSSCRAFAWVWLRAAGSRRRY